ncbi:HCNGP-like protein-domain-containing protein [Irpex rosettiformis]|uniref:HCNGP-like protein-domain-containing protein n=1 Tax=Irpex rosettiformis TaxID=378272 RepID=A0ACB8TZH0_9APHY|nr:HCNGP-like protein-domain-containing protein [Irpex rosettiformis]
MLHGLAAYGDEPLSDSGDGAGAFTAHRGNNSRKTMQNTDDTPSKSGADISSGSALNSKAQIVIKKHHPHTHPRVPRSPSTTSAAGPNESQRDAVNEAEDQLTRLRTLLVPPSIPGIEDWGVPREPTGMCDPEIEAKLAQFHALKRDTNNPKHFNDSLMANRSFRNPHLYTKLVEFVDVNERTTNFPKSLWDPEDVKDEWFAERIAEHQKQRSEQSSSTQASSKRTHLEFTSAKPHSSNPLASTSSKARAKDYRDRGNGDYQGRYQPYGYGGGREKGTRWK